MAGGHVDRNVLSSKFQNYGDTYDDTKTEQAMEVLAQQNDENWDAQAAHKAAAVLDHPDGSVKAQHIAPQSVTLDKLAPDIQTSGQPEVALARVSGPGNITFNTLKERLDNEIGNLPGIALDNAIDVCNPPLPTGLSKVRADGTDILGDTNRLQAIIDYAIGNKRDVYVPKDLTLQPIAQPDGTLVCIKFDDGMAQFGNDRKPFRIYAKKGVTIRSNNTTSKHTIFRWKMGQSVLDGFMFVGSTTYTTALEISRIKLNDINEPDYATHNRYSNLRFYTCNNCISMEGSAYYSTFDNISFYSSNMCLWLKVTYAVINGLKPGDSGVNRNFFYGLSAFGCKDGVRLDFGDTNKFYGLSFEGLSGTAIQLYDQYATNPNLHYTMYNTFTGVTNEANNFNLICDALGNSFIDFESNFSKVNFMEKPTVYIPSGDLGANHAMFQTLVTTNDQDVLEYLKNRMYARSPLGLYVGNVADYVGTDGAGKLRGFNWRKFAFTAAQCTNVTSLQFNTNTKQAIFKSIGGIVFYYAKLNVVPTVATNDIVIPLPELAPDTDIYSFGFNVNGAMGVGYLKDGANPVVLPAKISPTAGLTIPAPAGGWSIAAGGSSNVLLINIHYVRSFTSFVDTN